MKADMIVDPAMLAPCGMNCTVCYKHLGKKPCAGCTVESRNKPERCRKCNIKVCAEEKGLFQCFECAKFPCKFVKNLDKSYKTRYGASLVENSLSAKESGVESFLAGHLKRYTCKVCGGVISIHDGACSECGKVIYREEER